MKRLNITLPDELSLQLKSVSNKSRFISEALKEKFNREKRQKLDSLLVEGYKMTKKEDKSINKEWENITIKEWD